MTKKHRGKAATDIVGGLSAASKRGRKTMGPFEAAHEVRKAHDIAEGRSTRGRVLTEEEKREYCEARGLRVVG